MQSIHMTHLMTLFYSCGIPSSYLVKGSLQHTFPLASHEDPLYQADIMEANQAFAQMVWDKPNMEANQAFAQMVWDKPNESYTVRTSSQAYFIGHPVAGGLYLLGPFHIEGEDQVSSEDPKRQAYLDRLPVIQYFQINFLKIMVMGVAGVKQEALPDLLYNVPAKEDVSSFRATLLHYWSQQDLHMSQSQMHSVLFTLFRSPTEVEVRLKLRNLWKELGPGIPPLSTDPDNHWKNMLISTCGYFVDFAIRLGAEETLARTLMYNAIREIDQRTYEYDGLYLFEALVLQLYQLVQHPKKDQVSNLTNRAIAIIHRDMRNTATTKRIAEELECNAQYLSHRFHKEMGVTLNYYKNDTRIRYAKMLIVYSNSSIGEIAELMSFSSVQQFSALFKKHAHMTPTAYRSAYFAEGT